MERLLYRLSVSAHGNKFILKGALMLRVWGAPQSRPTMDIDLLGRTPNGLDVVAAIFRDVVEQSVSSDGLAFDARTLEARLIAEAAEYHGVRVRVQGSLGSARVMVQIDIGFGDVISPAPDRIQVPTLLGMSPPRMRGYTRETTIAEKLHVMATRGELNSRMKDFYDVWLLSRHFDFDGAVLAAAITRTFENRSTELPVAPLAFSPDFAADAGRARQWQAFVRRSRFELAPPDFRSLVGCVGEFLGPPLMSMARGGALPRLGKAPGPWV